MAGENSSFFSDKTMGASVPGDRLLSVRDLINRDRKEGRLPSFDELATEFLAQPAPGPEAGVLAQTLYGALVGYALTRDPELIGLPPTVPETLPPLQEW